MNIILPKDINRTISKIVVSSLSLTVIMGIGEAQASLIGDTVTAAQIFNENILQETTVVVDSGIELPDFGSFDIDFDSETITFVSNTNTVLILGDIEYQFTDLDWINSEPGFITGVDITVNPINPGDFSVLPTVSFTDDSVTLSLFPGITFSTDSEIELSLSVSHESVPEPTTVLGLGLLGLGMMFRGCKGKVKK